MPQSFPAQHYLETYYPSRFDEKEFLSVARMVEAASPFEPLDVKQRATQSGLSPAVVENVAIFCFLKRCARRLVEAFPQGEALLLDLGAGPTIYQHLFLSLAIDRIIHAEASPDNRQAVEDWLAARPMSYDWSRYFVIAQRLIREDREWRRLITLWMQDPDQSVRARGVHFQALLDAPSTTLFEEHLRRVIRQVVPCDVFVPTLEQDEADVLARAVEAQAVRGVPDIVSAHFLIESATDDRDRWEQGIHSCVGALRSGGYFLMTAIRHASWYRAGAAQLPAVAIDEKDIGNILREHAIVVEEQRVLVGSDQAEHGYDGMVFVLGKKT